MARYQEPDETEDFDNDIEDFFSDEENDDDRGDEGTASKAEQKRYEKMRLEIENSIAEAIANGDTNNNVYKGLQRVLAKRDREVAEYKAALENVIKRVNAVDEKADEAGFLKGIVKKMLDSDSQEAFEQEEKSFKSKKESDKQAELLQYIISNGFPGQQRTQPVPIEDEDPQITKYRREATVKLKDIAKRMGINPNSSELDYGDESEPLLERMDKLTKSVEKILNDEDADIERVRGRGSRPSTRTNRQTPGNRDEEDYANSNNLLRSSAQDYISKIRKMR